jgi:DNA-binding NarL/FixJ family response regulator
LFAAALQNQGEVVIRMPVTQISRIVWFERSKHESPGDRSDSEFKFSLAMHSRFGLTRAESRIAQGIVCGQSLTAIAKRYGISVLTGRTQLKSVLAKTETHSQAQLAILLLEIDSCVLIRRTAEAE